jgi:hypothetical protein
VGRKVPAEGVGVMKDEELEVRQRFDAPFQKLLLILVSACSQLSIFVCKWYACFLYAFLSVRGKSQVKFGMSHRLSSDYFYSSKKCPRWKMRKRKETAWRGLRLFASAWVSVGLPLCLDRALAHRFREFLTC